MGFQIAIDGPAGAGKSTVARRVAKEKGFVYVDTGAMYRAVALFLVRNGVRADDDEAVGLMCTGADVGIRYEDGEQIVLLNGENVNGFIRTQEVGNAASLSSANPRVRSHLFDLQLRLAGEHDVVMDGRDIGTLILPDAEVKIFLTASSRIRAKRRYLELKEKGVDCDFEEIVSEIELRDNQDMTRELAPLKKAVDAVLVDTSDLSVDEAVEVIISIADSVMA